MTDRRVTRSILRTVVFLVSALAALSTNAAERSAKPAFTQDVALPANRSFDITLEGEAASALSSAVMLDHFDVTALFERTSPTTLRYRGRGPALPSGVRTVTVYDVDAAGNWTQIGQFQVKLLSRHGFVSTKFDPSADVNGKGQVGEGHAPDANAPERATFQDATSQFAMRTELVRPSLTLRGEAQVAGVTNQREALRFGERAERAPRVDLAGYRIDLERGSTVLSLGHLNVGSFRHLLSGFSSRGVALTLGQGKTMSLQLAALNGSNIVGWSNPFGLDNSRHRALSAIVGWEALPKSPGLLRFETGYFVGSSQPVSGFNQAGVVTAEKSRGASYRIASAAPSGRWRVDAGYTASRFQDAFDAQVEEGLDVTPIETRTNEANYLDGSLTLLQSRKVGPTTASLTLNVRHENVEPLFRSLGASAQADLRSDATEMVFSLGPVNGTVSHLRTRDNLSSVDSILTTRTWRNVVNMSVPLATLLAHEGKEPRWAPVVTLQYEQLHQYADGVPPGGGFTIESIPDQFGWNGSVGAEWQIGTYRVGGRTGRSRQDNRQAGSENQDLTTDNSALTLGWNPTQDLSLGGELGLDRNTSTAEEKTDSTFRWAANVSWKFYREVAIAASVTNNRGWDDRNFRDSGNLDSFVELSSGFTLGRSAASTRKGRIFVRWIDRRNELVDRVFTLRDERSNNAVTTGLSLSLF
jgi:hypothetical protein